MQTAFPWLMVAATILFTIYGQLVIKWQVMLERTPPHPMLEGLPSLVQLLFRPWIISALLAAFLASMCWMLAMSRLELSRAYPFMALNFILVGFLAVPFFGEAMTRPKIIGLLFVIIGLVISSRG
ncbi:putative 4-amino-4-deoxy-L-arabinose-phosphoundecaprenol flippase subunit ArnE [Luteimonas padinae]|nr:putative 4-amino-4-deoxy-L-arabinose-phosphoundecaprenol flippase subunit ArnE [Luteimonas padinae]